MFIHNKYYFTYYSIIDRAKSRTLEGYSEKHHIIPKSLGGSDSKKNLVSLTAKEHYICHLLLTKMCNGEAHNKMIYAAWAMANLAKPQQERIKVNGRIYEILREKFIKSLPKGKDHPHYGRKTGRTANDFTPDWKEKISNACKGRIPWNKGKPRSQAVKDAVSKANKGKTAWNKGISRRWINNGSINKLVYPNELEKYLNDGWTQGRY